MLNVIAYFLISYYSFCFDGDIPSYVYFYAAFAMFGYYIMDILDGMVARKYKTGSPMGMLVDHGMNVYQMEWIPRLWLCQYFPHRSEYVFYNSCIWLVMSVPPGNLDWNAGISSSHYLHLLGVLSVFLCQPYPPSVFSCPYFLILSDTLLDTFVWVISMDPMKALCVSSCSTSSRPSTVWIKETSLLYSRHPSLQIWCIHYLLDLLLLSLGMHYQDQANYSRDQSS